MTWLLVVAFYVYDKPYSVWPINVSTTTVEVKSEKACKELAKKYQAKFENSCVKIKGFCYKVEE